MTGRPDDTSSAPARITRQRTAIERAISGAGRPLSPEEILERASADVPRLGLSTVYRTIRKLDEEGLIAQVNLPGQPPRYETSQAAESHHHHFRCESCDRVFDVHGCPGGFKAMLPAGFVLKGHSITLRGLCDRCAGEHG